MSRAGKIYTVDDLPTYSPWPARLLGLEPWTQRSKTPENIAREYEVEKWGPLLDRMRRSASPVSLEQVDEWALDGVPASLCSVEDNLELLTAADAHRRYVDLVAAEIQRYGSPAALVELGAGYGSVVLALARRPLYSGVPVVAADYTASGVEMLRMIGDTAGISLTAGHCDFASKAVVDFPLPPRAVIFTSFSVPYVRRLEATFVDALRRFDPAIVIHFEPCFEHFDAQSLLGLMRRRYIEINDYNTNLLTVLRDARDAGAIQILERAAVFGANPLLPASVIAWTPSA